MIAARFRTVEALNARNLSPEQVAASFVAPPQFDELWQKNNVLLMGPRGSGKTTMLKMLTTSALHTWTDDRALRVRRRMPSRAIYIPADIHWHHQLKESKIPLADLPQFKRLFSEVALTTNVFASVCGAIEDHIRFEANADSEIGSKMAEVMIKEWRLPPTARVLPAVEEQLRSRMNDLNIWANRAAHGGLRDSQIGTLPDHYYLDYLAAISPVCATFDDLMGSEVGRHWALCFDELELAPEWFQDRLFAELRGVNQSFLLKLSTSPAPKAIEATLATADNDFTVLRLWPASQDSAQVFAEEFVRHLLLRRGIERTPAELLGSSKVFGVGDEQEYERRSSTWHVFKEWAKTDDGFRRTLMLHGIDPGDPWTPDVHLRDVVLRKAKPLVHLRRETLKRSKFGGLVLRTRKVLPIYAGREAVYDVSDGNPRWLMGIMNALLAENGAGDGSRRISMEIQARVLKAAADHFEALLKAVPDSTVVVERQTWTLYSLLQRMGRFLFHGLAVRSFRLDPAGSFIVDAKVPEQIRRLLHMAVYQGALILVEDEGDPVSASLVGKRVRLSYRLAPTLHLPLRLLKAVNLSSCLSDPFLEAESADQVNFLKDEDL